MTNLDVGQRVEENRGKVTGVSADGAEFGAVGRGAGNVLNFQASPDFLNQFYMMLVRVQLDIDKIDGKFERQSQQINDMKLDIMSLKQDMIAVKQRQDAQQVQTDQRTLEMAGLKTQIGEVARVTGEMRSEMEGLTSKFSWRNRIDVWVVSGLSIGFGLWVVWQQIVK